MIILAVKIAMNRNSQAFFSMNALVIMTYGSATQNGFGAAAKRASKDISRKPERRNSLIFRKKTGMPMLKGRFFLAMIRFVKSMIPPKGHIQKQKKFPAIIINSIITSAGMKCFEKCTVEIVVEIASNPSILKKKSKGIFSGSGK